MTDQEQVVRYTVYVDRVVFPFKEDKVRIIGELYERARALNILLNKKAPEKPFGKRFLVEISESQTEAWDQFCRFAQEKGGKWEETIRYSRAKKSKG